MYSVIIALCLTNTPWIGEREVQTEATATDVRLELPAQIQAQPGQIFVVQAKTNLKWKRWTIPSGLTRVPPEHTKYGEDAFVGFGAAGLYQFKLEGTKDDNYKSAECSVFIGTPTPGPLPPPGPTPPAPSPTDPLFPALQTLYLADKNPQKAAQVKALADVYRTGAGVIRANKTIQTSEQLFEMLRQVADAALQAADGHRPLQPIRDAIRPEVAKCFAPGNLTDEGRAKGAECFLRIAGLLEALK